MQERDAETFEGGCDCRHVRYRLVRTPMFVNCCHCSWCQRETGSAFVINAVMATGEVQLLGEAPELIDTPSASGRGQQIARCPHCRVALWSHYAGAGRKLAFVRVGTLDTPARFPPQAHVFTSTKLPWVHLPPEQPAFEAFYDRDQLWSPEMLARRQTALNASEEPA